MSFESFESFDSLPTAADLEKAKTANSWIYFPRTGSAPVADNKKPNHQRIQGKFTGASHNQPTPTSKGDRNG